MGLAAVLGAVALGSVASAGPSPSNYPGRPAAGDVLWGATLNGQDLVARHEIPSGVDTRDASHILPVETSDGLHDQHGR